MARASLSQDGDSRERASGRLGQDICLLPPPFGPSRILPVRFQRQHCVLLSGPPVARQLRQVIIILPGQGGQFWSMVP